MFIQATLCINHLAIMMNAEAHGIHNLLGTMTLLRTRHCTDSRDRIFGLLGLRLGDQTPSSEIQADYTMSTAHIYQAGAVSLIEATGSLDVLSQGYQLRRRQLFSSARLQKQTEIAIHGTRLVSWHGRRTLLVDYGYMGGNSPHYYDMKRIDTCRVYPPWLS